jgi:hypothetical protein
MIKKLGYYLILLSCLIQPVLGQETVYVEADGQIGGGILRSRGSECFVITPAHVVENVLNRVSVIGSNFTQSRATVSKILSNDLALLYLTSGGIQNCGEWESSELLDDIIKKSTEGILEVTVFDGSKKLIRVSITEKQFNQLVVRPYFEDETIIKGYSGSVLYTLYKGEKVILGMLMEVDKYGKGIVLTQKAINSRLQDFFQSNRAFKPNYNLFGSSVLQRSVEKADLAPHTVQALGFLFKLTECFKKDNRIIMRFSITSLREEWPLSLYIYSNSHPPMALAYDQRGNIYRISEVKLETIVSNGEIKYIFPKGVALPMELMIDNVSSETHSIKRLFLMIIVEGNSEFIEFSNITFSKNNEE